MLLQNLFKPYGKLGITFSCLFVLSACGGGGGDSSGGSGGGTTPPVSYTVSTSAGSGGSLSPASRSVQSGQTTTFTVSTDTGYSITSVSGCGGSLSGSTYTTASITGNCTVTASFNLNSYTVTATAGEGGAITPASRTINHGATTTFEVTADAGYSIDAVTGCGGSLTGTTYTTGSITENCSVAAVFSALVGAHQALLGPLSGATIHAWLLDDLDNHIEGPITAAESLSDLTIAGSFNLQLQGVSDERWVLVGASGGRDIDADDDGELDSQPTENQGTIYALARAADWRNSSHKVTVLSDILWREVKAQGLNENEIEGALLWASLRLLGGDINGDKELSYRDILAFNPADDTHLAAITLRKTELLSLAGYLHQKDIGAYQSQIEQLLGQQLHLPPPVTTMMAQPQVSLPNNRQGVQLSNLKARSLLADLALVTKDDGATLILAENQEGKTVLLGYAWPGFDELAAEHLSAIPSEVKSRITAITGGPSGQPELSTASTTLALIMSMVGDIEQAQFRAMLAAKVVGHAEFEPTVDSVEGLFQADAFFLDNLAYYPDVVNQLAAIANASFSELLEEVYSEFEPAASDVVSTTGYREHAASAVDEGKTFCRFTPNQLCFSDWHKDQPWDWYGEANGINVRGKPFMAVNTLKRNLVATANPGLVNFSLQLYDANNQLIDWYLVPRSSTLLQKNLHSGAAQRLFYSGRYFPEATAYVEFHKYLLTKNQPGSLSVSIFNNLHLTSAIISLASTTVSSKLKEKVKLFEKLGPKLEKLSCAVEMIDGVNWFADRTKENIGYQALAFFSNNLSSLREGAFGCILPFMLKDIASVDNVADLALKASAELGLKLSNPAGWAVVVGSIAVNGSNELIPVATSYFSSENTPSIFAVHWNDNKVERFESLNGRPDKDSGYIRQLPKAQFVYQNDAGFTVHFDASSSIVDPKTSLTYSWSFSDGTSATGQNVTKTFAKRDFYHIELLVTDGWGQFDKYPLTLEVLNGRPPVVESFSCEIDTTVSNRVNVRIATSDFDNDIKELRWYLAASDIVPALVQEVVHANQYEASLIYPETTINNYSPRVVVLDQGGNQVSKICNTNGNVSVTSGKLNDTGIDWCANGSANNLACPVSGYEGQDGEYGRDALARSGQLAKVGGGAAGFDFTKLDASGNALPESASEWSCVRDNHTGLIWEVKSTDGGPRDKDNTYTWYNPDSSTNGRSAGTQGSNNTYKYVNDVNAQGLCGASDWRMPTRKELLSIVHNGRINPSIDQDYFPNTEANWFWSSSPYAIDSSYASHVNFSLGGAGSSSKSDLLRVRLVRAGQ